jgi:hypothetical protein
MCPRRRPASHPAETKIVECLAELQAALKARLACEGDAGLVVSAKTVREVLVGVRGMLYVFAPERA